MLIDGTVLFRWSMDVSCLFEEKLNHSVLYTKFSLKLPFAKLGATLVPIAVPLM